MSDQENVYRCADCGGEFVSMRSDEAAHDEAVNMWGVRGDDPGMVVVCDDCFVAIMNDGDD